MNLAFHGVELHDAEHERLAGFRRLAADANPLVHAALLQTI